MTWTEADIDRIYRRLDGGTWGATSKDTIKAVLHAADAVPNDRVEIVDRRHRKAFTMISVGEMLRQQAEYPMDLL